MQVKIIKHQKEQSYFISEANVEWEDTLRPSYRLFFAVASEHEALVPDSFDHFLVSVIAVALAFGEKRIWIDGEVSALLLKNLLDFEYLQRYYFGDYREGLTIQAKAVSSDSRRSTPPTSASLLSGGVDSLFTLHQNHNLFNLADENRISYGIWVARDSNIRPENDIALDQLRRTESRILKFCEDTHVSPITVISNDRGLWPADAWHFWGDRGHGAGFAANGHFLARGISKLYIPSTELDLHRNQWGSTVVTDQFLSSHRLQVAHDGVRFSRKEKLEAIMNWPLARARVKVCFHRPPGAINCGKCEKCLRTRLILLTMGALDETTAFEAGPIDPQLFDGRATRDFDLIGFYQAISDELKLLGQHDLSVATRNFAERSIETAKGKGNWELFW